MISFKKNKTRLLSFEIRFLFIPNDYASCTFIGSIILRIVFKVLLSFQFIAHDEIVKAGNVVNERKREQEEADRQIFEDESEMRLVEQS